MRKKLVVMLLVTIMAVSVIPVSKGVEDKIPDKALSGTSGITKVVIADYGLPKTVLQAAKNQNKFKEYTSAEAEVRINSVIIPYNKDDKGDEQPMPSIKGPSVTAEEYADSQSALTVKKIDKFFSDIQINILDHSMANEDAIKYFINITVESVYRQRLASGEIITFYGHDGYYVVVDQKGNLLHLIASFLDASTGEIYISNRKVDDNGSFLCGKSFAGPIKQNVVSVPRGNIKKICNFSQKDLRAVIPYWSNNKLGEYHADGEHIGGALETVFKATTSTDSIGSKFTTEATTSEETTTQETTTQETTTQETTTQETTTQETTTKETTAEITTTHATTTQMTTTEVTTMDTTLTKATEDYVTKAPAPKPDNTDDSGTQEVTVSTSAEPDDTDTLLDQLSKYSGDTKKNNEPEALGAALVGSDNNNNTNSGNDGDVGSGDGEEDISGLSTSSSSGQSFFDKAVGETSFKVSNIMMFLLPLVVIMGATALAISNKLVKKGDKEFIR